MRTCLALDLYQLAAGNPEGQPRAANSRIKDVDVADESTAVRSLQHSRPGGHGDVGPSQRHAAVRSPAPLLNKRPVDGTDNDAHGRRPHGRRPISFARVF